MRKCDRAKIFGRQNAKLRKCEISTMPKCQNAEIANFENWKMRKYGVQPCENARMRNCKN